MDREFQILREEIHVEIEIAQSPSRLVCTYLAVRDLAYRNIQVVKKDGMK